MCPMSHWNKSDNFTGCEVVPGKKYEMLHSLEYAESSGRPDWCPLINIDKEVEQMNITTMTIGQTEQDYELQKLREENKELKARCQDYVDRLDRLKDLEERAYMRGRIEGLEFSIRCNGVSGNEVEK